MSRYPDIDVAGWILAAFALGMGGLAAWLADSHHLSENITRAGAYTGVVFASLVMALRPAWHRPRLWIDLAVLLVLHVALFLPLINVLDSHSVRLNWAMALPFVAIELLLLLSLLWRRNVSDSSS